MTGTNEKDLWDPNRRLKIALNGKRKQTSFAWMPCQELLRKNDRASTLFGCALHFFSSFPALRFSRIIRNWIHKGARAQSEVRDLRTRQLRSWMITFDALAVGFVVREGVKGEPYEEEDNGRERRRRICWRFLSPQLFFSPVHYIGGLFLLAPPSPSSCKNMKCKKFSKLSSCCHNVETRSAYNIKLSCKFVRTVKGIWRNYSVL